MVTRTVVAGVLAGLMGVCLMPEAGLAEGPGLALQYPLDQGIEQHPSVLYVLNFDDQTATTAWHGGKTGYGWTDDPANVLAGGGALQIQQTAGTHYPMETYTGLPPGDVAYVRWYRKWQDGYDWTQHKMSGVYAKVPGAPPGGGAGIPPNGYDKYSCKLYVDWNRVPHFYTYHPEQAGPYGDGLAPNLGWVTLETQRWYCFEMMIKANTVTPGNSPPGNHDGELKMWVDGELVGHYQGMRFRDTEDLKINWLTYSAYVGGTWVSQQDQKLWDDQLIVATEYIGPLTDPGNPYWPTMSPDIKYLGDGLYGVTFTVHGNDGEQASFFANMTFEGTAGGEIQQVQAMGSFDVDSETDANSWDGVGDPPYEKDADSWFGDPFAKSPPASIVALTEAANYYHIEAGTGGGSAYEDAKLAYIVTTGDLSYYGVISRLAENYSVSGVAEMPLPGDANEDGSVDGADYTTWADNYQGSGVGWAGGDFNGDDTVDGADYTIWADNYAPAVPGSAVPEPAALSMLLVGGWALIRCNELRHLSR